MVLQILFKRKELPFSCLNDTEFSRLLNGESILHKKDLETTSTNFENINLFTEEENVSCKYYTKEQFKKLNLDKQNQNMSLLHLNIPSLCYHIDNLTHLLNGLNTKFKITAIAESRQTTTTKKKLY